MHSNILDGKKIAAQIQQELKSAIAKEEGRPPALAVILVGDHAASKIYVKNKQEACRLVGIESHLFHFNAHETKSTLKRQIEALNENPYIDGILIQLPLPPPLNATEVVTWISPEKDVDGLHPLNMGKLLMGMTEAFVPCTPLGIKALLDAYHISVSGKHIVVLGRSNIVGKPMGALLSQITPGFDATVTLLHRQSPALIPILSSADILVIAAGSPKMIQPSMVKEGAVVIDVGINEIESSPKRKVVGDVDFEAVKSKCSYISPVPGGVGPMTIAMLLSNTYRSYLQRK